PGARDGHGVRTGTGRAPKPTIGRRAGSRHLALRPLPVASIHSLPGSTTATTAASAAEAATTAAAPSTPARGFRHGRAEVARKTLQAAGKHDRRERAVPLVPARHRGAGIDAFEQIGRAHV